MKKLGGAEVHSNHMESMATVHVCVCVCMGGGSSTLYSATYD